jgi:hypothetical protein
MFVHLDVRIPPNSARDVLGRPRGLETPSICSGHGSGVLVIGNSAKTMCVGDKRAGYDLLVRRGHFGKVPSFEEWQNAVLSGGDANGAHIILKIRGKEIRAFADLTFGQVATKTSGAIEVPPAFAGFGEIEQKLAAEDERGLVRLPRPPAAGQHRGDQRGEWAHRRSRDVDDIASLPERRTAIHRRQRQVQQNWPR